MRNTLLSILIPTVEEREDSLWELIDSFNYLGDGKGYWGGTFLSKYEHKPIWASINLNDDIQINYCVDKKELTIGEKRNILYDYSDGLFSLMIDDDDRLADGAIDIILESIKSNPKVDCITFEEYIDIDGKIQQGNHSLKYDDWHDNFDGYDYVRTPFMKSVIKTEIARSVPIPHVRFGEDHLWSQALKPHLQTEIHIDKQLYRYIHRSSDFNERYGYDRN